MRKLWETELDLICPAEVQELSSHVLQTNGDLESCSDSPVQALLRNVIMLELDS
jgi:hypothetical protein